MEFSWKRMLKMKTNLFLAGVSIVCFGQVPVQFNPIASRSVGQAKLQLVSGAPNLVEGRELNAPIGVAVDSGVTPPIVYISDTSNNRVLVWRNGRATPGTKADFVIGQNDFFSTLPLGPGTSNSVGLRSPTGVAVDRQGNLFVIDTANNRILRYARVTEQGDLIQPNLVIGQSSFTANTPNQGNAAPSAKTLALSNGSTLYTAQMVFDASGNLWVTDPGNNRILRYPANAVGASASNGPDADLVIGQSSMTALQVVDWGKAESRLLKSALLQPSALAFDANGRLLVADGTNRMLVYASPFRTGQDAVRLAGLVVNVQGQPARPPVNEYTLYSPEGIFTNSAGIFVVESQTHRIVRFDPFEQWPDETETLPSPAAKAVFGQPDLLSFRANRGGREPSESGFQSPTGVTLANNEVYLADSGNNRILVMPLNGTQLGAATRVFGQLGFNYRSINLVEGRELYLSSGTSQLPNSAGSVVLGGAVVIDRNSNPPRLYISDTFNNRILGYADARLVKPGATADVVIGQTSLFETKANSPTADVDQVTDQGLLNPAGIAVDSNGNLYVADSGNGRVLRFSRPFDQPQKVGQRANLVLGQSGFNIKITDPTQRNMARPYGLAFTVDGHLLVSDFAHNRVLLFRKAATGDFSNSQAAATVFGQRDYVTAAASAEETRFNSPMHIATDTDDRLYVCDSGNRRVAIFDRVLQATNNAAPAITLTIGENSGDRLGNIQGINVSSRTGEIWIADTQNNRVLRYPRFDVLTLTPTPNFKIPTNLPQAVSIDAFDNLLIAEGTNRVAFHYPSLLAASAGHYLRRRISPGMIAAMYPQGIRFGEQTATNSTSPLATDLADIQVLVDEVPTPLYFVSPTQINFYVPMRLEPGTQSTFIVQRKSTNDIYASGLLDVGTATPSFFTTTQNGQGQIAALNEDNTVNTNTNGIDRGKVIQLFATGQGFIPNAPPDGTASSGLVRTPDLPRIIIGSGFVPDEAIEYSGLAPGFVGVWQINVRIPMSVPPGSATDVVITMRSIPSNQAESGGTPIRTVIAVK